ncbi:hypothetical protein H6G76_12010 [Nostoc sp. FACHB-152]|uniref:hypothetical protein n=1 Tax=unclassified Nostoc TaxID=2593658 RepID=UPI001683DC89|nr:MULTISPECIES: hypothetical protein [unclassified Nostoc]MBD2447889.1 hypothetical protein [Nostoc sp. FACHB-152]MBD2468537.1 hypothetical protein [Nostoc sp. FACHB-145]
MFNQRLLAAFLAVTTVTTTIAVNASPSYGNSRTNVQYLARNEIPLNRADVVDILDRVNRTIDILRKGYESRDFPQQVLTQLTRMQNYLEDILDGHISGSQSYLDRFRDELNEIEQRLYDDVREYGRERQRQRYRED